jgi:hypothetical protein
MPEAGMDTLEFRNELKRLYAIGFREIRLDLPLVRSEEGLPMADTGLIPVIPSLLQACREVFPYWSIALTRLHPDSIADSLSVRKLGTGIWCNAYILEAEKYLACLPGKPRHLIAGWSLPETDTLPCLEEWMHSLSLRAEQVCWLLPPERLPHRLQQAGTETGILWVLPGDQASKPAARNLAKSISQHISPHTSLYIGAFSPRAGQAPEDFRNLFRFWPEHISLSGVTFATVFPFSTLTDSLNPGTLYYEQELKQEISHYLLHP